MLIKQTDSSSLHHILVVDDDSRILKLLQQFLQKNNFIVSTADSAKLALSILENFSFDLVILDIMMPEMDGIEFATKIRNSSINIPIVMLTALSEPEDRIRGLESGANDYIGKPFEPKELLLRINNLLANQKYNTNTLFRFGNNLYNIKTKELLRDNSPIKLSTSEQILLECLIEAKSTPVSREEISRKMNINAVRSVDVQITRIRSKIESNPKYPIHLQSIRNYGYVLYLN